MRPTLRSLLIAIAFYLSRTAICASHSIALHCNGDPKMLTLKQEVLRREMPRARKVLSCKKPKAEKSFGAKCRGQGKSFCAKSRRQRSPSVCKAEGGKVLSCEMPKARYDQPVLKSRRHPKKSPVMRKAEGREVLRREMPKARKVLSCEKPKAEKSFGAKC